MAAPGRKSALNRCQSVRQGQRPQTGKPVGLRPPLLIPPAPTLLYWLRAARTARRFVARPRARHLRPMQPPGASLQNSVTCGPRRPGFPIKPGSGRKNGPKPGTDVGEKNTLTSTKCPSGRVGIHFNKAGKSSRKKAVKSGGKVRPSV
ncbi:hypothetical protein [Photorhabdus cinerea]|uniref:hypothetical protein n=1 Tax=Photorhabdus cinerea TaxID=471575 RepID=UPI00140D4FC0|nr:hypothetical protein [Photorhabdus cinerea]